jgi:hypothetical protein
MHGLAQFGNSENRMKLVTGENEELVQAPASPERTTSPDAAVSEKAPNEAAEAASDDMLLDLDEAAAAFFQDENQDDDTPEGGASDPEVEAAVIDEDEDDNEAAVTKATEPAASASEEVDADNDTRPRWQRKWANTSAATLAAGQHPVLSIPSPTSAGAKQDGAGNASELRQRRGADGNSPQPQQQVSTSLDGQRASKKQPRTGFGSSWSLEDIVQVLRVVLVVALGVVTGVRWATYVLESPDCLNYLPPSTSEAERIARYGSKQPRVLDSDAAIGELAHGLREAMPLPLLGESVMLSLAAAAMFEQLAVRALRKHAIPNASQTMGGFMGGADGGMGGMVMQAVRMFGGPTAVAVLDTGKQVMTVFGAVTTDSALAFVVTVITAAVTMMVAQVQ